MNVRLKAATRFKFVRTAILVSLLWVLCGENVAQEFKTVHPGVEHAQITHKIGNDPVRINLLRLDLKKVRLDVHHAFDKAIGVEPTSAIAKRHNAIAAINAGFFRLDKSKFAGDAAGVLKIDGKTWSESINNRSALFIFNARSGTDVAIGVIESRPQVVDAKNRAVSADGVNRERRENELIVYTPEFAASTLTPDGGVEAIIRKGKVVSVVEGKGDNPIPVDGFIVSASGDRRALIQGMIKLKKLRFDVVEEVARSTVSGDLKQQGSDYTDQDIVGGVSALVKEGKPNLTWQQEKASRSFAETRHPRTAVAKLKDGKFLMITVDGRQPGVSVGMTLQELAEYLQSLGATDAMNLDGGGSTTMYLDGRIVNTPSDKEGERKVSDAIVVTLRDRR